MKLEKLNEIVQYNYMIVYISISFRLNSFNLNNIADLSYRNYYGLEQWHLINVKYIV